MKVLIVSYSPLTLMNNGGKYMLSLFSEFSEVEMCQVYTNNTLPDMKRCSSYYRVTDKDVIGALTGKSGQHELSDTEYQSISNRINTANITLNSITKSTNRYQQLLVRDILWKVSPWKRDLFRWIEREKPDCIFSDTGDSCFLYKISMMLSKKYSLPMIGSFGDDYYAITAEKTEVFKRIQLHFLRKEIKKFVNKCEKVITINDWFSQYYSETFNMPLETKVITLANGSNFDFSTLADKAKTENLTFSYLGNFSLGREKNLLDIGNALSAYNKDHSTNHRLKVYAKDYLNFSDKCVEIGAIEYMGFVTGDGFINAIAQSDILIHVESFEKDNIEQTRLSLSTKIADSLNSGKCLLAYGPAEISSMQHLIKNKCAHVITSKDMLYEELSNLIINDALRDKYIHEAKKTACVYHDSKRNSQKTYCLLKEMI